MNVCMQGLYVYVCVNSVHLRHCMFVYMYVLHLVKSKTHVWFWQCQWKKMSNRSVMDPTVSRKGRSFWIPVWQRSWSVIIVTQIFSIFICLVYAHDIMLINFEWRLSHFHHTYNLKDMSKVARLVSFNITFLNSLGMWNIYTVMDLFTACAHAKS